MLIVIEKTSPFKLCRVKAHLAPCSNQGREEWQSWRGLLNLWGRPEGCSTDALIAYQTASNSISALGITTPSQFQAHTTPGKFCLSIVKINQEVQVVIPSPLAEVSAEKFYLCKTLIIDTGDKLVSKHFCYDHFMSERVSMENGLPWILRLTERKPCAQDWPLISWPDTPYAFSYIC